MVNFEKIKTKITTLIETINTTTGNEDITLSDGINSLIGGYGKGSGSSLNIHYGDTAPKDTSMLWCKCNEAKTVIISSDIPKLPQTFEIINTEQLITHPRCDAVRVGDIIYTFGEMTNIGKYNLLTDELTVINDILPDRNIGYGGFAAVGTNIYIMGGNGLNTIYVFDTVTESLALLDVQLPCALHYSAVEAIGNKIYVLGGNSGGYSMNTVYEFNTETNELITLSATVPYSYNSGHVSLGTKIYLFGGFYKVQNSSVTTYRSQIYEFDIETQNVRTVNANLSAGVENISCCLVGTKVYLFGGFGRKGNTSDNYDTIQVFDIETDKIVTLDVTIPMSNSNFASFLHGTNIYMFLGLNLYEYTLNAGLDSGSLQIIPDFSSHTFELVSGGISVELGISDVLIGTSENTVEHVETYLYNGEWTLI